MLAKDGKAVLEKEVSFNRPGFNRQMNSPEKIAIFAKEVLRIHENAEEYLYMVCLNNKLMMTSVFELSHGNVNSSIFSVREILQKALLANAVSIIVMHNHPTGDPTPSREDIDVTKRLVEAGQIVGVQVLDHLIIGHNYTSLKERGDI
jgi:DNA repair protein RadC